MSADILAADQLKSIVQRVERLEAEISDLNADKSEIYKEARANGFDVKAIKKVVSKRKLDEHERVEMDHVFDTYWDAIHGLKLVHTHARENIEEFDADTGEILDEPRRSDGGLNILTKHEDIRTAPETGEETPKQVYGDSVEAATAPPSQSVDIPAGGENDQEIDGSNDGCPAERHSPETATVPSSEQSEGNGSRDHQHVHSRQTDEAKHGGQDGEPAGADHASHSDQPLTGGGHEVAGIAPRERETVTSNTGEGAAKPALPANPAERPKSALRPHCKNPGDNCGGFGSTHCHNCLKARQEEEA